MEFSAADPSLKTFFTEWQTYRLFKDANFLHHREVTAILHGELSKRATPFSFLDLASGDASASSEFLHGTKISSYTAVDFSRPALDLALENTAALPCPRRFFEKDFADFAEHSRETFDILFLGLSLHHQPTLRKQEILTALRRLTAPAGTLYLYEPILAPGETREQLLPRWKQYLETFPAPIPTASREVIWSHVDACDFPETLDEYFTAGRTAGYSEPSCLFTDPHQMYSLLKFPAPLG